jgi:hypothetical protein
MEEPVASAEESTRLEFDVQLVFADYHRFFWWHIKRSWGLKLLVGVWTAFAAAEIARTTTSRSVSADAWLGIGVAGAAGAAFLVLSSRFTAAKSWATHKSLREPQHYVISANGIGVSTPSASGRCDWSAYWRAFETNTDFYLLLNSLSATIIPKRSLRGLEEVKRFRDIVQANMPAEACRFRRHGRSGGSPT